MERDILHLAVPAFAIALARCHDPALRGRPVAVAAGNTERALLQCVSAEALGEGLHEGMPVHRARRLCPPLLLLPPDPAGNARGMRALLELCGRYTPLWEPATPGRLFLDLTGSRRLFGPGRDTAMRLERELRQRLSLSGSVGVAGNKLVSRIAAGYLQQPGVCDILRGSEQSFIAPLPVSVLPGVGQARQLTLLRELNLRRVAEVALLPLPALRLAFGGFAPLLRQRAQGIDPTPVQPPRRAPQVQAESFLPEADNDDAVLLAVLGQLAEDCGRQLRRLERGSGRLGLTLFYADGVTEQGHSAPPRPLQLDQDLLDAGDALFHRIARRRLRLTGLRLCCEQLCHPAAQFDLFSPTAASPRADALQQAMDALRDRHGVAILQRGRCLAVR